MGPKVKLGCSHLKSSLEATASEILTHICDNFHILSTFKKKTKSWTQKAQLSTVGVQNLYKSQGCSVDLCLFITCFRGSVWGQSRCAMFYIGIYGK